MPCTSVLSLVVVEMSIDLFSGLQGQFGVVSEFHLPRTSFGLRPTIVAHLLVVFSHKPNLQEVYSVLPNVFAAPKTSQQFRT